MQIYGFSSEINKNFDEKNRVKMKKMHKTNKKNAQLTRKPIVHYPFFTSLYFTFRRITLAE